MNIRFDAISDVGRVRSNNEDMALVFGQQVRDSSISLNFDAPEGCRLTAIVADGMGGYERGEVASAMATQSFDEFLQTLPGGLEQGEVVTAVKQWAAVANQSIMEAAQGTGMGTTFSGLFTYGSQAFIVNVGDSRTYRLRYELLKQMTTDHSERNRLHDDSVASNLIFNAFGVGSAFIDVIPTHLVTGDVFLVCSDGLTDMVSDECIKKILEQTDGDAARELVDAAREAGGEDNITVVVVKVT